MKYKLSILCTMALFSLPVLGSRYALLVGANNGGEDVSTLRYAENDVRQLSNILRDLAGFPLKNIWTVFNPDSAALEKELAAITTDIQNHSSGQASLMMFYYSGHADSERLKLGTGGYSLQRVKDYLKSIHSRIKIGIFDACHSGAVTQFKGGKRSEPFYMERNEDIEGQIIIASSAAEELAQESESLKGSVFSHHWFNGLRGSADFSGDKRVTLNEAYQYAYRKTVETTALTGGGIQHPSYQFNISGRGHIVLTDLSTGTGGVYFNRDFEGKHLVLSDDYTSVLADFYKESGQSSFISLNPGNYMFINVSGNKTKTHRFSIKGDAIHYMNTDSLVSNPLTITRLKGANPNVKQRIERRGSPLSGYTWGLGVGAAFGLSKNQEFEDNLSLLKINFLNTWYLDPISNLFLDIDIFPLDYHFGGHLGMDWVYQTRRKSLFAGLGAGLYAFTNNKLELKDELGLSLKAHIGMLLDVGKRTQIQIRMPYQFVVNRHKDMTIGLDFVIMFPGLYRNINVLND